MNPINITLLTYGSRGDVEPFLALADRLTDAGHQVTLAAPEKYRGLLDNDRVRYHGLPGDPGALADELRERAGDNLVKIYTAMTRHVLPIAADVFQEINATSRGADVILHSFIMADGGHTVARRQGALDISVQFFPAFQPTSAFPAMVFPDLPWGGFYRRLTHHINTWTFRWGGRLMYAFLRRKHSGLPRLAEWPFSSKAPARVPIFYAFSKHVLPRPSDWPDHALVTGYWHRQRGTDWRPPRMVARFLEEHPRPVFIGLGSMVPDPAGSLIDLFCDALQEIGAPGLIAVYDPGRHAPGHRGDTLITGGMPHDWILPQTRAAVHHGGAGTTGAVIRAGIPGVVVPVSADQFFWGRRVHELGVGPEPVPFKKLTVDKLRTALQKTLSNPSLQARARELGNKVQQEDGVHRAVKEIERLYKVRREGG